MAPSLSFRDVTPRDRAFGLRIQADAAGGLRDVVLMRLRFSRRAEAALEEVADYIARDNPMRAASFARELRKRCRRLVRFPERRSALDQSTGVKVNFEARTILVGPETKRQRPL